MKYLRATKVKDGYLVNIIRTEHIPCKSDVLKLIKQEGLEAKPYFSHKPTKEEPNETIYAE